MKAVLISIKPKWCDAIAAEEKTIEVRKTRPKIKTPFKCYIYETNNTEGVQDFSDLEDYRIGKVIGEFICTKISKYSYTYEFGYEISEKEFNETALTAEQFADYGKGKTLYGWHISDLVIYDKPKELSEYIGVCRQPDEIQCENCPYCNWYDVHFCTDKRRTITRPPQSWCYVEVEKC